MKPLKKKKKGESMKLMEILVSLLFFIFILLKEKIKITTRDSIFIQPETCDAKSAVTFRPYWCVVL